MVEWLGQIFDSSLLSSKFLAMRNLTLYIVLVFFSKKSNLTPPPEMIEELMEYFRKRALENMNFSLNDVKIVRGRYTLTVAFRLRYGCTLEVYDIFTARIFSGIHILKNMKTAFYKKRFT